MQVDDYAQRTVGLKGRVGKPLEASTKATQLSAVRTFFRDCQEWEWIPRPSTPQRALATPRGIAALLGPDPLVIADEVWAKLMWAGLNLAENDLPQSQDGNFYPLELVRAVTLAWLFSGQRSDEIARLRVGCIRCSATAPRSPATRGRSWPVTQSARWTCQSTRPGPRSPSRST